MTYAEFGAQADSEIAAADFAAADLRVQLQAAIDAEHIAEDAVEALRVTLDELIADRQTDQVLIARLRQRRTELAAALKACRDGEPIPDPEPQPRFAGDTGKVQYGWDVEGTLSRVMGAEITRMSAVEPARDRTPQWCHKYSNVGENLWTSGGDCTWAAARGINIFINYSVWDPNHAKRVNAGEFDGWIRGQAAAWKNAHEQYGTFGIFAIANEADAPDKEWDNTAAGRLEMRKAGMRIDHIFHEEGVTNVTQASPPSIAQLFHNSVNLAKVGGAWPEYVPQLLPGVDPREWASVNGVPGIYCPPREAFDFTYPWLLGINQYCWHTQNGYGNYSPKDGIWGADWTLERALKHTALNDSDSKHGALANKVATALDVPIVISEMGGLVYEKRGGADPDKTIQWWLKNHDELDAGQVAVAIVWKQVLESDNADVSSSALAFGGRHAQMSETGTKGQPDPTNSKRRGFAAAMDQATL